MAETIKSALAGLKWKILDFYSAFEHYSYHQIKTVLYDMAMPRNRIVSYFKRDCIQVKAQTLYFFS